MEERVIRIVRPRDVPSAQEHQRVPFDNFQNPNIQRKESDSEKRVGYSRSIRNQKHRCIQKVRPPLCPRRVSHVRSATRDRLTESRPERLHQTERARRGPSDRFGSIVRPDIPYIHTYDQKRQSNQRQTHIRTTPMRNDLTNDRVWHSRSKKRIGGCSNPRRTRARSVSA